MTNKNTNKQRREFQRVTANVRKTGTTGQIVKEGAEDQLNTVGGRWHLSWGGTDTLMNCYRSSSSLLQDNFVLSLIRLDVGN